MLRPPVLLALLVLPSVAATAQGPYPLDDVLRLNDLQAVGTHNSYHLRPPFEPAPPDLDYEHDPLDVQLEEQGVRKFELDVYWAPDGFRVHHINVLDARTNCETLVLCLETIRGWSETHPGHHPLFVFVEPKGIHSETTISDEPITGHYDQLDAEIRSVLAPDLLITPDEVRGAHATLREAIRSDGWPTLGETRGRVLAVMLDGGTDRANYSAGRSSLEGRAMFVTSSEGRDDAAVIAVDGPEGGFDRSQNRVALGYVVRTRSDSPGNPPRAERRDAAFASGAHVISTDLPVPGRVDGDPDFAVQIPGGTPSRCNPITTLDVDCTSLDIEDPALLSAEDGDEDGVPDGRDNCLDVANPAQTDSDRDGYGNRCDADYDNNGAVGIADFAVLRSQFGLTDTDPSFDPTVDMNDDGAVGLSDFNMLRGSFGGPPGPSALECAGTIPCP